MNALRWVLVIFGLTVMLVIGYLIGKGETPPTVEAKSDPSLEDIYYGRTAAKPSEEAGPWTEYADEEKKVVLDAEEPWAEYQQPATGVNKAEWIEEANKKSAERQAAKDQAELIAEAVVDEQEARDAQKPRP